MGELSWRPYRSADRSAVVRLINDIDAHAGADHPLTDDMLGDYERLLGDVTANARVVVAGDGTVVAFAWTPPPPPGGYRVDLWGGVHPDWRSRGLGRELLAWQLDRAAEIHRSAGTAGPWTTQTGAAAKDVSAARLYARFGLVPIRYFVYMERSTADPPAVATPDGLVVAPYDAAREVAVH